VRPLASILLDHDLQTVVFGRSRLAVELLLTYLREDASKAGRDPATIKGYRGGYLPTERRRIEEGLRDGRVRGVVATNALELGVDIGGLTACIMAGYPGTIASTWQQAGRAGRGCEDSVAFLVASSSPLDQYIISHPDYFFGQSPEHALINPNNLYVLLSHLKCATFELPFKSGESYGNEDVSEMLAYLEEGGLVRRSGQAWHWAASTSPAHEISLRTADPNGVTICEQAEGEARRTIGELGRGSAPLFLYEGAIYLHEGQQFLVESLDWEGGLALVRPVSVDYYTEASRSTTIHIERALAETHFPNMSLARGEVTQTSRVTGYRRLRLGSQEHLGWGEVNLPEQQMLTTACWMTIPEELVARLREEGWWVGEHVGSRGPSWPAQRDKARRRDGYRCRWCGAPERPGRQHEVHHIRPFREFGWLPGENENHLQANALSNLITLCSSCHRRAEQNVSVQSTLSRLGRVIGHLIPLLLMCDPSDVSIHSEVQAPQTGLPTLFIVDNAPGGAGLSEEIPSLFGELLSKAAELVRDCPCVSGCPSCIGPADEAERQAKQQVLRLIAALQEPPQDSGHQA
jgi:DEAD/DEAH box helicase domain-containing protein